ncbi:MULTISPECIES: TolC family protein [Ramlibacter]|uniref:Cobalt-zinc-cadmium resistance protein n=1 Tax=Ramlibacter pinisoli TaxID=2682844 RepID=A0A6N8IS26_9BURK|nr:MULTISPECIES: TolC family protein [Ramlibacter]MBA2964672.1 TolC family protein [Ramlibacter sp. CGMCC 1.13660]MVQ29638.1 cobalt-zinc-cadmium resistance protein [Ramlibacter pinisoli]
MRNHLLPLGLAAALLSPLASFAQASAGPLTLDQALQLATDRNPTLSAARRDVDAADGALHQAGALRNPTLNASVEDIRRDTRSTTVTLDYPLELGGKRVARVTAAERARDVAQAGLSNARAQLRATVIAAFFQTLVAQERLKLAASSADLAGRAATAVGKRVTAGKVSPVEETRARVDAANAQLEAAEAQAEVEVSRQALAAALGEPELGFTEVTADAAVVPQRPPSPQLLASLDASPALLPGRFEVERRRALVDVERTRARPDVTVSVGAKRDNELGRTQALIGMSIPLPLVDRNQGAIQEAMKLADKAADELQATRLRLGAEVQQASSRLAVARTSAATLRDTVLPAAQSAYEAATKGFEAGKFGFIDVLDAQRSLLAARSRYLNTLAAAHQAATAIDRVVGP